MHIIAQCKMCSTKPDFFFPQHKVGTILVMCEKIKAVRKMKVAISLQRAESAICGTIHGTLCLPHSYSLVSGNVVVACSAPAVSIILYNN